MIKSFVYIINELGLKWQSIRHVAMLLVATGLELLSVGVVLPVLLLLFNSQTSTNTSKFGVGLISKAQQVLGADPQNTMLIGVMVLVVAYVSKALFLTFLSFRQSSFTFLVQTRLSERLFSKYMEMPYVDFIQRNSAIMIRNIIIETTHFSNNVIYIGLNLFAEILILIALSVFIFSIEPFGSLIGLVFLSSIVFGFRFLTHKRVSRWGRERQLADGHRITTVQQSLHGIKELRVFNKEDYALKLFRQFDGDTANSLRKEQSLKQLPRIWLEFGAIAGIIMLGFFMMSSGMERGMLVGKLGIFAAVAFRLLPTMTRIISGFQSIRFGVPAINILCNELLKQGAPYGIDAGIGTAVKQYPDGFICFEGVSFSYPSASQQIFSDISFTISKGQCVGIIGSSGSGKSTLLEIIVGLLVPSQGRFLVDGKDISNPSHLREWRDRIGYVSQHIYLFDDSIRNNVAFGVPSDSQDEKRIKSCLEKAQLGSFVCSLPKGIDEMIGDRGVRMSGGQRQRIGIARALYRDPSLLILDEGTSALDDATERDLIQVIKNIKGKCSIIIVAHRLSTLVVCDRIMELTNGKLSDIEIPKNDIPSGMDFQIQEKGAPRQNSQNAETLSV